MPKLFIANTSKQNHHFAFRLPEWQGPKFDMIQVGGQIAVCSGQDLSQDQVDFIIKSHVPYGLRSVTEAAKEKDFVGLCYSIGKPVTLDSFGKVFEHNEDAMKERAAERRQETVAAVAESLRNTGAPMQRAEVEIIEETRGGATPSISEGVEIVAPGVEPRHKGPMAERRKGK